MSSIDEIDSSQSFKSLIHVPLHFSDLYQEPLRLPTASDTRFRLN